MKFWQTKKDLINRSFFMGIEVGRAVCYNTSRCRIELRISVRDHKYTKGYWISQLDILPREDVNFFNSQGLEIPTSPDPILTLIEMFPPKSYCHSCGEYRVVFQKCPNGCKENYIFNARICSDKEYRIDSFEVWDRYVRGYNDWETYVG